MFDETSHALRCKQPNVSDGSHVGRGETQELILVISRYTGCLRLGIERKVGRSDGLELVGNINYTCTGSRNMVL